MLNKDEILALSKDDLAEFAEAELGMSLDKRQKLETLQNEVVSRLANEPTANQDVATGAPVESEYIRHKTNGRVQARTELLWATGHYVACDKDGK